VTTTLLEMSDSEPSQDEQGTCLLEPWLARRDLLFRLCLRWTRGNRSDAEDLLSEACLRALQARGSNVGVRNALSFSATIIANLARDRRRMERRGNVERLGTESQHALPSGEPWPDDLAHAREALRRTFVALESVPERQRWAVRLRSLGVEYSCIADELGTSLQNARKLVQFARAAIQPSG
jgi:RNA polymerase sigma factor (sigma-70 family)